MADRVLTWYAMEAYGNKYRMSPTFYMEADYSPIAVRINAEVAPDIEDAEFNIYDDGVTIFADRSSKSFKTRTGRVESDGAETTILLMKGESEEIDAEDFKESLLIEKGSWISCNCIKDGGGKNFTVHLELEQISEDNEPEE